MRSSISRRIMVVGSFLFVGAGAIACLYHGAQSSVEGGKRDALKAAVGGERVALTESSEGVSESSVERRPSVSGNSAEGRAFSSSSAVSFARRFGSPAPVAGGDLLEAPAAGSTKVRDRSHDIAMRSSGQTHVHGSRVEAAGMPSAAGVTAFAKGAIAVNSSPQETAQDTTEDGGQAAPETVKPADLPLVYRLSDEELLEHSPGIAPEVLEPIRDQFDRDAGVGELDPADPEYTRRWNMAAPTADERYRTLFGWAAYNDMSRRAAQAGQ